MDPRTPACKLAYENWAKKAMPWILDPPEDAADRLVRATALIAFERGYDAGYAAAIKSATGQ